MSLNIDVKAILQDCYEMQVNNINKTYGSIKPEVFEQALEAIQHADNIFVIGMRSSFSLAHAMHHGLNQLLGNSNLVTNSQGVLDDKVLDMTPNDLLIAISLPRYSLYTVEFFKTLKEEKGIKTIAITAATDSPVEKYADILLPCEYNSLTYQNSLSGAAFIIETILTSLALNMPEKAKQRLSEAENILKKLKSHMQYNT